MRLRKASCEERVATLEHPYNSWLWYWNQAEEAQQEGHDFSHGSMCCFGGRREKWFALLGNSQFIGQALHMPDCPGHDGLLPYEVHRDADGNLVFDTEEESKYPEGWCKAYAMALKKEFEHRGWIREAIYDGRKAWIAGELAQSTERLKDEAVAMDVAGDISQLELNMQPGLERAHLKEMLRKLTIRGAELKLHLQGSHEEMPYPAYRWYFKKVFSFKWKDDLHINVGELNAFIAMAERRAAHVEKHGSKYLAILDSQVVRGAIGKGRSSSKPINRGLRKLAALLLFSDASPLLAWTISRWNWADEPSRVFK